MAKYKQMNCTDVEQLQDNAPAKRIHKMQSSSTSLLLVAAAVGAMVIVFFLWNYTLPFIFPSWMFSPDVPNTRVWDTRRKVSCYYGMENLYGSKVVTPRDIDPFMCTHIIAAFITVANGSLVPPTPYKHQVYEELIKLKEKNPALIILPCLGGNSNDLSDIARTKEKRSIFIHEILKFLQTYKLDGLDIDWEFPAWLRPEEEKHNFLSLLQEFRQVFQNQYVLTVAVAAPPVMVDACYEVEEMAKYIDYINLMTYDFHFYSWLQPITGANAPLFPRQSEVLKTQNTAYSANYWVSRGMPKNKILVGIPTYGHTYKLLDSHHSGYNALATGYGFGRAGFAMYSEICNFLQDGAKRVFDNDSLVPYAWKDLDWVSYDDEESVAFKANWIRENDFAGAMVFDIGSDDVFQQCSTSFKRCPLVHIISDIVLS